MVYRLAFSDLKILKNVVLASHLYCYDVQDSNGSFAVVLFWLQTILEAEHMNLQTVAIYGKSNSHLQKKVIAIFKTVQHKFLAQKMFIISIFPLKA